MLTIRLLLFALIMFVGMNAQSQQPVPPASPENEAQPQRATGVRDTIQSNRGTKQSPIVVELLPAKDAESKVNEEREHQREKSFYDGLIAWGTVALAGFTLFLFIFTALLWATTVQLGREARRTSDRQAQEVQKSLAISQQAADAATKSAEAAVNASKPFLFPRAFNLGSLHPVEKVRDDMKYDPAVNFVFENYGETPAMVREVRADLILSELGGEIPPLPSVEALTTRRSESLSVIPGHRHDNEALEMEKRHQMRSSNAY